MADESDWVDSIHDLYGYAILHASQIATDKDTIAIASDPIRESFNEKLTRSKELYDKYQASAKKSDELRAAAMRNSGVSDADLDAAK